MSLFRRIFMALCLAAIAVMAYFLFYHEPCLMQQQNLRNALIDLEKQKNTTALEFKVIREEVEVLRSENMKLEEKISSLDRNVRSTKEEVKAGILRVTNSAGIAQEHLSFDEESELIPRGDSQDSVSFRIQSTYAPLYDFLQRIPELPGLLRTWALEMEDLAKGGDTLSLLMEIEP